MRTPRIVGRSVPARACTALALIGACASVGVFAAPLVRPRPAPEILSPLAPSAVTSTIGPSCGTRVDALPESYAELAEHAALTAGAPLPTPHSTDVGEIAVLEDDGTLFFTDKGGNMNLDVAAAGRAFYRTHGDDYDELALWLASGLSNWLGSPTALAGAWLTRNDILGLGLDLFDYNTSLGLPPRIQTVLTMNGLDRYLDDPMAELPGLPYYTTMDVMAHEFGHRWLAYPLVDDGSGSSPLLLGRSHQHWSFFLNADASIMDGPDWQVAAPDSFVMTTPVARFGVLDQYLMGVRARDEVDSLLVVSDTAVFQPPSPYGPYVPFSDPKEGITARGPARRLTLADLDAAQGPRVPDAAHAPHGMRVAFALIVPRGSAATAADLAKVEAIRSAFPATVSQFTAGRMTLDATLDSHAGRLRLEHTRLPDTEEPGVARPVGLKVRVDQAGIPIAVRPDGVSVSWRGDPGAPWTPIPMQAAAPDSFVALVPGLASGQTLEYWFHAESDSAGLSTDLPELSLSTPFRSFTGPDVTPPVVVQWPQYEQSIDRLPQPLLARVTDNLGVDTVWCESTWNGGPLMTLPSVRAGQDSFVVSLGAGAPLGTRIAYRIAARDRSAAGNIGYSNVLFDTLRVGRDWVDEFWDPAPWVHGYVLWNRRDEWHLVEGPGSPSGSGAWHCGLDSIPYGPYEDAVLRSELVYNITPGCWLSFVHKYDLEDAPGGIAYDGARVEIAGADGVFSPATPLNGYTHIMALTDQGLPQNAPCWSGRQEAWREDKIDLSPYAPGPVRVRFRMSTDLFVGRGGWWIDQVRFQFPDPSMTEVPDERSSDVRLGPLWPNPAGRLLRQSLRLPRGASVEWALYDLAGRRVATLWRGALASGPHDLAGEVPGALAGGLYFSRLHIDGRAWPARRVALLR